MVILLKICCEIPIIAYLAYGGIFAQISGMTRCLTVLICRPGQGGHGSETRWVYFAGWVWLLGCSKPVLVSYILGSLIWFWVPSLPSRAYR